MSKSVYVRVVHDLELLKYVLSCAIERQASFGQNVTIIGGGGSTVRRAETAARRRTMTEYVASKPCYSIVVGM